MISEILTHTPLSVWAMLAFFIYRGLAATRDRDVPLWSVFILPVVLVGLSLQGIVNHYGLAAAPLLSWFLAALAGALLGLRTMTQRSVGLGQRGILMRGSWLPLVLVLAVFATKYSTEVMIVMRPDLMMQSGSILGVCVLYGILSGFFLGRLTRTLLLHRALARQAASTSCEGAQAA